MLVIFKSKAAADVTMYEENAKPILDLLHKDIRRGVVTAAETGNAIATIEAEISAQPPAQPGHYDDEDHTSRNRVGFPTRVYPFLEMLRAANQKGVDVMWGV